MSLPKRILWSANDPGGMNAIAPVIRALLLRGDAVSGIATGPAVAIANYQDLPVADASGYGSEELELAVQAARANVFLAGTSAGDSIDKKIFRLIPHTPSVYVLDFWSNYRMRFSTQGEHLGYLPTFICVMDELARQEMLADGIPDDIIRVTGNPHTEHFTEGITREREDAHEILFISQPMREVDGLKYGFDEYVALEHVSRAVQVLPEPYCLHIRLHPKDEPHKFDRYLNERVAIATEGTLEAALSAAGLVIGMFSPVLIQAAAAGKRVVSYEPGLIGSDPLATNRMGLTRKLSSEDELRDALAVYARGEWRSAQLDPSALWPKGAAERILQIVDTLIVDTAI